MQTHNSSLLDERDFATKLRAYNYKRQQTVYLKRFDSDTRMELLYLILVNEAKIEWGIADYLDDLSTSPQSNSSMHLFIRDLIKDGALIVCTEHKLTSKHLVLSEQLRMEVDQYQRMQKSEVSTALNAQEVNTLLRSFQTGE